MCVFREGKSYFLARGIREDFMKWLSFRGNERWGLVFHIKETILSKARW